MKLLFSCIFILFSCAVFADTHKARANFIIFDEELGKCYFTDSGTADKIIVDCSEEEARFFADSAGISFDIEYREENGVFLLSGYGLVSSGELRLFESFDFSGKCGVAEDCQ